MTVPDNPLPRYATLRATRRQLLEAALQYAAMGLRVIPCQSFRRRKCTCWKRDCPSAGKHPILDNWPVLATTDPATIIQWWTTGCSAGG